MIRVGEKKIMVASGSLRLAGVTAESVVDGPGLRLVVFAQGCPRSCKGCHNPETQSFEGGEKWEIDQILEMVAVNPLLSGVTLTGGEPFAQAEGLGALAQRVKGLNLNVVTFTGYTFEELLAATDNIGWQLLLQHTDLLIEGPFIEAQKDLNLAFRGSSNQRLIDVPKSLAAGTVVQVAIE